ncbi:hypothetical protein [Flavobacterium sp. ASW18X]|uniref:hypothetical protein n=1 Tax=Flavobacterium sp. ASW18X TaxID=2572595 RepID=UPI0010AEBD1C|nr:hypothetical protein [Flavobacterium sp. ASW18X]TKD54390.1 hypothetical protein FBT53_15950 [Flavobacterium sp. ASW18X]
MRELLNTFLDTTKERIKNPFIGAFIFSFVAFNWKPIFVILFASQTIQEKIEIVESEYTGLLYNLWLPILFALFYVLILPYIMWLFDRIASKAVVGRKENVLEQQLFDLRSKQRLAEQESRLEDIRASFRETADLNKKIDILSTQIEERDKTIEVLQTELETAQDDQSRLQNFLRHQNDNSLTEKQKEDFAKKYESFKTSDLYEFFKEVGSEISRRNSVPNNMDDLIIEKFRHTDIIREVRDEENQRTYYEFTKKGEFFWKEYILNLKIVRKPDPKDDLPF